MVDLSTLLTAMTGTGLVSVAAARWLSQRLVEHRLSKGMKDYDAEIQRTLASYKADIEERLAKAKSELDAKLRLEVEEVLGEKAAERQYRVEARKRLYTAVGPLRFQLILAANELSNRVVRLGDPRYTFDASLCGHFGRSTGYRLLRVFAVLELIERQIAYADFAVDPFFSSLLRFKRLAFSCMSSERVSLDHPGNDWLNQSQHIFYDTLSAIASRLVVNESSTQQRVMRFDEFSEYVADATNQKLLHPVPKLLAGLSPTKKPILWLRLVALATLCQTFSRWQGRSLGLDSMQLNWDELLRTSEDEFILANSERYVQMLNENDQAFSSTEG